jgi:hypothetical protein
VLNPIGLLRRPGAAALTRCRIEQLCSEMALDVRRAYAWTFVRTVLAVVWAFEDGGDAPAEWVECARWLRGKCG